jgi:hypothetical protein
MSLLIKGVEMPTDHPLWIVVHSDGTVEANEVSPSRPVGWQTLRNAAVPVPPHGRLIDKDIMCNECRRIAEEYDGIYPDCTYCPAHLAPTILEAEEGE